MALLTLCFIYLTAQLVAAYRTCPILGRVFPLPTALASSARLQNAFVEFKTTLGQGLATGQSTHDPLPNSSSSAVQV